ncbi:hypothetical protein [Clostridium sp. LIBA-8841]|uniref:hypothetical protein n=1 Tax=Clostridium sp. LIBA-8841 TaxID=2987530 RepID=UPI002AC38925|nr:hypothetical protein [Clostridium sp. LIBA-8841]MDZ5252080.1 hypothetical protein [Clostridium sp. LIBA-8841]
MDRYKMNAHKYFLYGVQEYFFNKYCKIENKKIQSLRSLLEDYIDLEMNIRLNSSDVKKLLNGKKALLECILFTLHNIPLNKNKEFSKDIQLIIPLIESAIEQINLEKSGDVTKTSEREKSNKILYSCLSSFRKKVKNYNILNCLIDIHNKFDRTFKDVEILVDYYVSELLFEGYSLSYLKSWYKQNFNNDDINKAKDEEELQNYIEKFKELSENNKKKFEVKISINLPDSLKKYVLENNKKTIDNIEYCVLSESEIPTNNKFKVTPKSVCLKADIIACDEIKAVQVATSTIENYIEVYKAFDTSIGAMPITGCYVENTILDLKGTQDYSKYVNEREKEDIQEFIYLREKNHNNRTIKDIERVINIVQKLSNDTSENRLLNAWSALENILRFYDSKSIIGKITEIIPKLIVMYSIKREMNNLWDSILPLINKNKIDIPELTNCKSVLNDKKYDKEKFALFLMKEETGSKLYECTQSNVIINKSVVDLNTWLKNPRELLDKIIFDEEAIRHNITTIYRLRNDLVHNGGIVDKNIENKILMLRYYINCILGTLIHHIKRNEELTIEEVLNSIIVTYNTYIQDIQYLKNLTSKKYENIKKQGYTLRDLSNKKDEANKLEIQKLEEEIIKQKSEIEDIIVEFGIGNIAYPRYLYI